MPKTLRKTVVFDLDGTLADTSGDLIEAANYCFRSLGYGDVLDPVADASVAFHGGRAMLKLGFDRVTPGHDGGEIEAQFPVLIAAYGANIDAHTRIYDGAMAAVAELRARGYAVTICTNKPEGLAETLLTRLGIRDAFDVLIGADTLPTRKPDAAPLLAAITRAGGDPAQSVLIGDTITDRDAGKNANVPVILVGFGPTGRAVADLNPAAILDHYRDLPDLVAELIGAA